MYIGLFLGSAWKVLESRICWQEWKSIRCVEQENDRLRAWLRSSLASQVCGARTRERQEAENQMLLMGWDGRDRHPRHLERGKVKNSSLLVLLGCQLSHWEECTFQCWVT